MEPRPGAGAARRDRGRRGRHRGPGHGRSRHGRSRCRRRCWRRRRRRPGQRPGGGVTSQPVSLSVAAAKLPKLGKAEALVFKTAASQTGTFTATATVNAKTAKRLRLGKKATKVGAGKAVLSKAGSAKLTVRLTAEAIARLRKQRKPVAIAVKIAFKGATGGSTARTVPLTLKR